MTAFPKQPVFYKSDREPINMVDDYNGEIAFLICSGPSSLEVDTELLYGAGIFRMGVNNSPSIVRPHFWTHVDAPDRFLKSIWMDATIKKFVPWKHRNGKLWDNHNKKEMKQKPINLSQTYFYDWQLGFNPDTWIQQKNFNWGNSEKQEFIFNGKAYKGGRSCMLIAIKILIVLGFKRIYLVGCDFKMESKQPYAFDQAKGKGGVKGNNKSYQKFNQYYTALKPKFDACGIEIYNTYKDSGLRAFKYVPYLDAIEDAQRGIGNVKTEPTNHMYKSIKDKKKTAEKGVDKGRTTYEGFFKTKATTEVYTNKLVPSDLLAVEDNLIRINPIFASACKVAKERKDIYLSQEDHVVAGANLEEVMMPLLNLFKKTFVVEPNHYKRIANFDYKRTIVVNGDELTLESFLT